MNIQEAKKNLDKPLLRRKSDLPTDILTQKSLETYQVSGLSAPIQLETSLNFFLLCITEKFGSRRGMILTVLSSLNHNC